MVICASTCCTMDSFLYPIPICNLFLLMIKREGLLVRKYVHNMQTENSVIARVISAFPPQYKDLLLIDILYCCLFSDAANHVDRSKDVSGSTIGTHEMFSMMRCYCTSVACDVQ